MINLFPYKYDHYITIFYLNANKQSISNYGQDPRLRAKLDTNVLANLFECWPDMEYNILDCSQVSYTPFV